MGGIVNNINSYVIISADNPCGCKLSPAENNKQEEKLKKAIRKMGYGYTDIEGNFFHNEEDSFFIPKMTKEDGIKLGIQFKQYSIIYGFKDINKWGNPFFIHTMVRTYCDAPCNIPTKEKWEEMNLDQKLRKFKPLPENKIGEIDSKAYISMSGKETNRRDTNFSSKDNRKFVIPFYDDPFHDVRPSKKLGTNTWVSTQDSIDDYHRRADKLTLDDKFAAVDYQ